MMQSKGRHSKIWKLFFIYEDGQVALPFNVTQSQASWPARPRALQSSLGHFLTRIHSLRFPLLCQEKNLLRRLSPFQLSRPGSRGGDLLNWKWSTIFQSSQIIFDLKIIFPVQSHSMDRVTCGVMNSEINFQFWFPNLIWVECFRVLYWFPVSWLLSAVN